MSCLVLMYHRVADLERDPFGLAVRPDRFAAHLEVLRSRGVVPLTDVLSVGRAPRIAITFDDGYADNADVAAPLLAAAALPATWFITTGALGGRRFWWDRLAHAVLGDHPLPGALDAVVGDRRLWFDLSDVGARRTALRFLHRRLRPAPPDEIEEVVDGVVTALDAPEPPPGDRAMTVGQLRGLAAETLFDIGAHTRSHLQLAGQRVELQRQEVHGSVDDVAEVVGRQVTTFAYPFGTRRAVGSVAPDLVRDRGCVLACSTEPGVVTARSDPYRLPRLNVRNWTRQEFAARIERFLATG